MRNSGHLQFSKTRACIILFGEPRCFFPPVEILIDGDIILRPTFSSPWMLLTGYPDSSLRSACVCVCVWNKRHQLAVFLFLPWQTIITVQHLFFSENIIQPLFCWTFPCHKQTVETPKINISISPTFIFNLPPAKTPTQWHYPGSVLHNTQACNSIFPQPSAGADLMTVVLDRDIINNSPVGF